MNAEILDGIKNLPKDLFGWLWCKFEEVPTLFLWLVAIIITLIIYAKNN